MIGERTTQAMAAAKASGIKLGNQEQAEINWAKVVARAQALRPHIERCIKNWPCISSAIAADLNARGIADGFRCSFTDWVFELKFDGFRACADTVRGRLASRAGHRLQRFEGVLDLLPKGHVFDGELVALAAAGRPSFNALMFGHLPPIYVAFDLLMADGEDLRLLPLRERKARLAAIEKRRELDRAHEWNRRRRACAVPGCGRCGPRGHRRQASGDAYHPKLARWHQILNRTYSQRRGRAEWFRERRGRHAGRY